jgi:hypothetical protein
MSPAHPPVKCFFSETETIVRHTAVYLRSTSPKMLCGFGSPSGRDESVKSVVRITYEA